MSARTTAKQAQDLKMSLPVLALTTLGILIAVLGLFAAGDMGVVLIGLGAVFGAGLVGIGERLTRRKESDR